MIDIDCWFISIVMSFSQAKETTDESVESIQKNGEAQNFLPNVIEDDNSSKIFSSGSLKLGKKSY